MINSKEKAKKLVNKYFYLFSVELENTIDNYEAKQCALIAVDEILEQLDEILNITAGNYIYKILDYWQEVKKEIELL